jgi:uncharacterized RDD family membrane protein YckC
MRRTERRAAQPGSPYTPSPAIKGTSVSSQYPQPYPQQPYPPQGYGGYPPPGTQLPPGVQYASWGRRAVAYLVDNLTLLACLIPAIPFGALVERTADPVTDEPPLWAPILFGLALLAGFLVWAWNYLWRMGKTGQSWGKQVLGVHLVRAGDLRPPGGGTSLGRYLIRAALSQVTCGIYGIVTLLWPLWDDRRQTLEDKMLSTLVVRFPGKVRF